MIRKEEDDLNFYCAYSLTDDKKQQRVTWKIVAKNIQKNLVMEKLQKKEKKKNEKWEEGKKKVSKSMRRF